MILYKGQVVEAGSVENVINKAHPLQVINRLHPQA